MKAWFTRYFDLDRHGTTVGREAIAGVTTFVTMAYIIIVNPKILEAAGIPFGPSMVATVLTAAFGTLTMGVYAKRPFAWASMRSAPSPSPPTWARTRSSRTRS